MPMDLPNVSAILRLLILISFPSALAHLYFLQIFPAATFLITWVPFLFDLTARRSSLTRTLPSSNRFLKTRGTWCGLTPVRKICYMVSRLGVRFSSGESGKGWSVSLSVDRADDEREVALRIMLDLLRRFGSRSLVRLRSSFCFSSFAALAFAFEIPLLTLFFAFLCLKLKSMISG